MVLSVSSDSTGIIQSSIFDSHGKDVLESQGEAATYMLLELPCTCLLFSSYEDFDQLTMSSTTSTIILVLKNAGMMLLFDANLVK